MAAATSVPHPTVGVGVLDDPRAAISDHLYIKMSRRCRKWQRSTPQSASLTAPLPKGRYGLARIIRSSVRPPPRCRGGCPHPPSRRAARNGGEDGWLIQPKFSQTAAQGRAGTPAPTTRVGRVRNMPPSVSSHAICWRGGQDNTNVSRRPTEGPSRTPTPTVGW